jgi:hypothetical protein
MKRVDEGFSRAYEDWRGFNSVDEDWRELMRWWR